MVGSRGPSGQQVPVEGGPGARTVQPVTPQLRPALGQVTLQSLGGGSLGSAPARYAHACRSLVPGGDAVLSRGDGQDLQEGAP